MSCKNCNKKLSDQENFCSNCGQKNITNLNIKFILGDFFQTMFNLDSKVFKSLKFLLFKPGYLTKEYIDGRRVSYLVPIRLYIALSFIYFFLISAFNFDNKSELDADVLYYSSESRTEATSKDSGHEFTLGGEDIFVSIKEFKRMRYEGVLDQTLDSLTSEVSDVEALISRKLVLAELDGKGFINTIRDQFSLFLLLFLPFFAMLYGAVFSRSKRGLVGHLIFNLHLNSFLIFILLIDLGIGSLLGGK